MEAENLGCDVILGDRSSKVTLTRLFESFTMSTLIASLMKLGTTRKDEETEYCTENFFLVFFLILLSNGPI